MTTHRTAHHDWTGLTAPERFRYPDLSVQVRGDWACFSRPEFSSERVSYPVMTPTAAQGVLSSVFWKPQVRWIVTRIEVLAPVAWTTMRRNESGSAITDHHRKTGYLDVNDVVQQRMTTMLRDVRYRISSNIWVHPEADEQDPAKWRAQFTRRVERGQTYRPPFLGMREFHADIEAADDSPPIDWTEDLGIMLHSISYDERSGKETYDWFEARVDNGVLLVPRSGLSVTEGGH